MMLNMVWAQAARLAFRFDPRAAIWAVMVVPMLSPSISGTAASKLNTPFSASTCTIAIVALELCNIIVIGLSTLEVDSIGSYIMGHDPTELPYTRVGKERGLGECDPNKIDLYWIRNGEIVPVKDLSEIKRYRLGVNLHTWSETGKRLFW